MDDISGNSPLMDDFSHLNADMLHTILELVSDGIWDWNANTGFVYRSPGWYEMLGYLRHSLENSVFTFPGDNGWRPGSGRLVPPGSGFHPTAIAVVG